MRILMISVARMDRGGIESYLMSLIRQFDHKDCHVDFVVHRQESGCYENEIKGWGSNIYRLPRLRKHPFKYIRQLYQLIKNGNYDIVHRHATASVMWIDLAIAKLAGVEVRIAHSHSTSWNHKCIHKLFIPLLNYYATDRFACSNKAGEWMYGKKAFTIMKNAVNIKKFSFEKTIRDKYRKDLGIEEKKVVLHVARFTSEKNHEWVIRLISKIEEKNIVFCFVGDGPLRDSIQEKVMELGLNDRTLFLGQRNDVNNIMMACDCFILPSLFEGLPVTVIEAQCTGLNCIVSDNVTKEVDLGMVSFLPLNESDWVNLIHKFDLDEHIRENGILNIVKNGYSTEYTSKVMLGYYMKRIYK